LVHHDLWDADIATPPVLYDADIAGKPRKALAALRADGYFFFLDRETGQPLFPRLPHGMAPGRAERSDRRSRST
jgi:glucose dehydrogenase